MKLTSIRLQCPIDHRIMGSLIRSLTLYNLTGGASSALALQPWSCPSSTFFAHYSLSGFRVYSVIEIFAVQTKVLTLNWEQYGGCVSPHP